MTTAEITFRDALALAKSVRCGEVGAEAILDAHLEAIGEFNPQINAFITVSDTAARAEARAIDKDVTAGRAVGPLAGVPVGVKDITETAGIRTTYGSRLFADHVPARDAVIVQRLKQAGAVIIGKTNTPEFATGASLLDDPFGPSRNPWNTAFSTGASTGAAAAALACGMIALATGTDLGGSLRVPAAFCGVVGLRPTPGSVPAVPTETPFDGLDAQGLMARSARDLAAGLAIIAGPHSAFPNGFSPPTFDDQVRLRLAFAHDIAAIGVDSEIKALCTAAAIQLGEFGHDVEMIDLDLSDGRSAFVALRGQWMVDRHYRRLDRRAEMGPILAGNIERGLGQQPVDLARAQATRTAMWRKSVDLFTRYDALVTPTTAIPPFPIEIGHPTTLNGQPMESYIDWAAPTFLISLIGLPAVSVPCGLTASGLPVGLQIIGPRFSDHRLLDLAERVEQQIRIGRPVLVSGTTGSV